MSSTFSPGSEDSVLGSSQQVCEQSHSVKSNPIAVPSLGGTGQTSLSMQTSANLMEPLIGEQLTLFAEDTPANPSVLPDRAAAQRMKGISGQKCIDLYEKSGRDGSLPRMLVGMLSLVSTRLPHLWKLKTSPSGRLLFQLAPLTRRIGGTESGLLPTPTVQMRSRPDIAIQQAMKGEPLYKRRDKAGSGRQFSITDWLLYHRYFPTPTRSDHKGASSNCKHVMEGGVSYLRYFLHYHLQPSSRTTYPHPSFVEKMMGYPIGHTDLGDWVMPSFRKSRKSSDVPLLEWIKPSPKKDEDKG